MTNMPAWIRFPLAILLIVLIIVAMALGILWEWLVEAWRLIKRGWIWLQKLFRSSVL